MKKIFTFFLALVASVGTIFASDYDKEEVDDIWYIFDSSKQTASVVSPPSGLLRSYSGSVVIPASVTYNGITYSVTSIGEGAFYGDKLLTSVTIPNSVTSIGSGAFQGCTGLTSVTIPNSVTSIERGAFVECESLTSITIPNSVTSIENNTFLRCYSLKSVTIPNSVTSIGHSAFWNCSSLTSITIPNSVTSIGDNAFYRCYSLKSLTIPNSVISIGHSAFEECTGLTSITIPNSVTSIGWTVFMYCYSLTSVTIGNGVTSIGYHAFKDCKSLTSVTIEAETPPTLDQEAFYNTKIDTIYVPCNAVNTYKTAEEWSRYANRIVGNGNCTSSYTIKFKNWDGSVLQSTQVEEGKMPQYTGTTPTKPDDAQYTYTFSGWTPQIVAATADATYTATYTDTPKSQGVEDVQSDEVQSTKVIRNGQIYILRGDKTYTVTGQEVK